MIPFSRFVLPCLFAALFVLSGPVAALALLPPARAGNPAIVVGPSAAETVKMANGQLIGPVTAPFAVFATFDHPSKIAIGPRQAWIIRDGRALAAACAAVLEVFE